jgi:hypothetical protein
LTNRIDTAAAIDLGYPAGGRPRKIDGQIRNF